MIGLRHLLALLGAACAFTGSAQAGSMSSGSAASQFCDRSHQLTAAEQDRLLRFAAVLRDELGSGGESVALVSRSGLDLSRFNIRYSHAALAWKSDAGAWSARQLYYACDEGRPRIYDQGLAGFAIGTDDPALGYLSIVRLPPEAARTLRPALLDNDRVRHLLGATYSANAYAFSTEYQNCNQWVMESLAAGWGQLDDGDDLRTRAQDWLRARAQIVAIIQHARAGLAAPGAVRAAAGRCGLAPDHAGLSLCPAGASGRSSGPGP